MFHFWLRPANFFAICSGFSCQKQTNWRTVRLGSGIKKGVYQGTEVLPKFCDGMDWFSMCRARSWKMLCGFVAVDPRKTTLPRCVRNVLQVSAKQRGSAARRTSHFVAEREGKSADKSLCLRNAGATVGQEISDDQCGLGAWWFEWCNCVSWATDQPLHCNVATWLWQCFECFEICCTSEVITVCTVRWLVGPTRNTWEKGRPLFVDFLCFGKTSWKLWTCVRVDPRVVGLEKRTDLYSAKFFATWDVLVCQVMPSRTCLTRWLQTVLKRCGLNCPTSGHFAMWIHLASPEKPWNPRCMKLSARARWNKTTWG